MKRTKHFLSLFLIMLIVVLGAISCDNIQTSESTSTTVIETTVTTVTSTTETSLPQTTVTQSTVETTTELPTTETTTISTTTTVDTTNQTTVETTTETTTTYVSGDEISVTSPSKTSYEVFDELDLTGLIVTYTNNSGSSRELNETEYSVSNVDMDTYGTKQVIIEYQTFVSSFFIDVNLPSYLSSATDLDGSALLLELRSIVNNGFHGVNYGDARYILDETDRDPNNSNNLIQVYTGDSVSGVWDCDGVCVWNREHTWPQSAMPVSASNGTVNMASDLHNLKPSDPSENSYRGNKYFANTSTSSAYEPRDEVKGDVARIMLYMVVMYDELTLVDSTPNTGNYEMGLLSVLLEWNEQDPVDAFERNRNDIIYSYQHNYNPFILYPNFADLIWE